jgi:hypothetical protein
MAHQQNDKETSRSDAPDCETRIQFALVIRTTCDCVKAITETILRAPNTRILYQRVSTRYLKVIEEDYDGGVK